MTSSGLRNTALKAKLDNPTFSIHSVANSVHRIDSDEFFLDDTEWTPKDVSDFCIFKQIGKGAFSKVYLCRRRADGKLFALKSMRKELILKMKQASYS
jgi:hypothetical protein